MKHYTYYETLSTRHPTKNEFITRFWYKNGVSIARKGPSEVLPTRLGDSTISLTDCVVENSFDTDGYKRAIEEYRAERTRLEEEFKIDALEFVGMLDDGAGEIIFKKAWEEGHAGGYSEVLAELERLVDFVKYIDDARERHKQNNKR